MDIYLERLADIVERRTGGIRPTYEELAASELMRSMVLGCNCSTCDRCGQPFQGTPTLPTAGGKLHFLKSMVAAVLSGVSWLAESHPVRWLSSKIDQAKWPWLTPNLAEENPIPDELSEHASSTGIRTASKRAAPRKEQKSSGTGKARKHASKIATIGQLVQPVSSVPAPKPPVRACDAESAATPAGLPATLTVSTPSPCKAARIHRHAPKAKVKTRPTGTLAGALLHGTINENEEPVSVPPSPQIVHMSSASREILARMLATDPSNTSPIHFDDFVAAMVDAGFTPKRCGRSAGSAVRFKDTRTDKGSITFHCPHPDPRIDHNKLRTWGSRLNKKFGWELETLVEREK